MMRTTLLLLLTILLTACGTARRDRIRLPVNPAPELVRVQPSIYGRLDALMSDAERQRTVPGAVLTVRRGGILLYERAIGVEEPGGKIPVERGTFFDIASLTKPLAGVPLGILLVPEWADLFQDAPSLVEIFSHRAGYPSIISAERMALEGFLPACSTTPPLFVPGSFDHYSNAGYQILAARVLQELGDDAEALLRERYWAPLGAEALIWRPRASAIAASGRRPNGEWIRGEPYDPAAAWMLGNERVPPLHSGLFARADDVARFMDALMLLPRDASSELRALHMLLFLDAAQKQQFTDASFWQYRTPGGLSADPRRPLGNATRPVGELLWQSGYTGCFLWVDVPRRTTVVLLSNASADSRPEQFERLRNAIIETVETSTLP